MNISSSTFYSNCCDFLTCHFADQLSPLQKKVAACVLTLLSCAALGYALYHCYSFKARELSKEEIDEDDSDESIELGEQKEDIEVIEDEDEIGEFIDKAPNLNNAKVSLLNSVKGVSVVVHDLALNILVVGWFESAKPGLENGKIYDLKSGNLIGKLAFKKFPDAELRHLKIDTSHQQIIGGLKTHTLAVWNLDGSLVKEFDAKKEIRSLPDGSFRPIFADCYSSDQLKQFNPAYTSPIYPVHSTLTDRAIHQHSFIHHDEDRNLLVYSSKKMKVIQADNKSILQEFDYSKGNLSLYDQKKGHLIYLNPNNTIVVYDVPHNRQIQSFDLETGEELVKMTYHEETNRLITCSTLPDANKPGWMRVWIRIWDINTGEFLNRFMTVNEKDLCHYASCMLYLPQFDLLFTGSALNDRTCCVWDLKTETLNKKIELAKDLPIHQMSYDKQTNQLYITQLNLSPGECETSVVDLS